MALHRLKGNSTSDSWSRCDPNQYSHLYDVRKRTDIKQEPIAATRPIHKDTIEISHDKLKEEALNRLRHTSKYVIAQNSFMRIGKYLFLAAALPPFFLFYGLPRWTIVEGMPALLAFSLWMWKKIQGQAEKQIQAGNRKVAQLMQFVQRVAQVMLQPLVHLALQIRQSIRRFRDRSLHLINKMNAKVKQSFHFPRLNIIFNQRMNDVRHFFFKIQDKCFKKKEEVSLRLHQGIRWVKNCPQLILEWGQFQFQRLNTKMLSLIDPLRNRFETSQKWAQKGTDWISNRIANCFKMFTKPFVLMHRLYKAYIQFHLKKLKETCNQKWEKVENFLQRRHHRAFAFLQAQQDLLKRLSSDRFLLFIAFHPWMKKQHSHLQNLLKKCLFHPATRKMCDGVLRGYSLSINFLLQLGKIGLHALSYAKSFFKRCFSGLRGIARSMSTPIYSFMEVALRLLLRGGVYILYYSLLFLTICFILLMWAFHSLREYTSYLFSTFSFNFRKI